ncbi:hypothetical protein GOB93_13630 [Acetobacter musti]|uniref:Uncharacterized protein n=1 Tax=Acetobacter musti TaxID=864732 RepID=A0ABX0JW01_9PROT|nr:hypothetical protein [Acetobacter musti]NHN85674.1 hypothetical protein [Acetobacter musti]
MGVSGNRRRLRLLFDSIEPGLQIVDLLRLGFNEIGQSPYIHATGCGCGNGSGFRGGEGGI